MADKVQESLKDEKFGIGQRADGSIDTFPLSELPARAKKDKEEADAQEFAFQQAQEGFPEEADDLSDLDEVDELFGGKAKPAKSLL